LHSRNASLSLDNTSLSLPNELLCVRNDPLPLPAGFANARNASLCSRNRRLQDCNGASFSQPVVEIFRSLA
jgi:hypothetical protein